MALVALSAVPAKVASDAIDYGVEQRGLAGLSGLGSPFYAGGPFVSYL
jgi:hypothetical protein